MSRNVAYYVRLISFLLFILIVVGYSLYQARNIILGPRIDLVSPLNNETYTDPVVEIKGTAIDSAYFSIDDNPVLLDEQGHFDESLLLAPGYNIIKLEAEDKFGTKRDVLLMLILQSQFNPVPTVPVTATTSTTTTSTTSTSH